MISRAPPAADSKTEDAPNSVGGLEEARRGESYTAEGMPRSGSEGCMGQQQHRVRLPLAPALSEIDLPVASSNELIRCRNPSN